MSSPLCLDLKKRGAARYLCGCFITSPFAEAAEMLGLAVTANPKDGEIAKARVSVRYRAGGTAYLLRSYLHTLNAKDGRCCFHLEYEVDDGSRAKTSCGPEIGMTAFDAGLTCLFSRAESEERNAQLYVAWEGDAPVVADICTPGDWPSGVVVAGARLIDPTGKANAIIQQFSDKSPMATVVLAIDGGCGLLPKQVRGGLPIAFRLAEAFRGGKWDVIEKEVEAYECL